ncbi:M18 aspartyl aminopeptidase, putative [Plasmodium yoelii]|uniref:aspartyl aminopeptidase n=3 Tax=Plasmodium yoelii TaxID=5861 RepID=A0AAE9WTR1_PLAYO|nr:M18 aspartyl aminopeptidase, putative [Plasmodium yoelii]WBY56927.1 M18 aspartyl aminopeptidase [Plasmodium yoelii yoelii]CDU17724.1 M18 aspartyl aminopeptidase, putative [Plasmodium yoelii]VTZ77728.1 M18 aspartyl aminopeptidase, putative [Plasmodium yoelii]|eukprot:XP_731194.2 M18 aspartyl aminopeptidase, putative [Plasmodium yoelii]
MDKKAREYAQEALKFIQRSGSNFMACKNLREKLESHGLIHIKEGDQWKLQKNQGYVLCKENRNICSFFIGKNFNINNGSILISIGHIDSCTLKISPNNKVTKDQISQLNVECYGSGLWHTWFDRGLGLSGQVVYKKDNKLIEKIIQINKSVLFLPSLAIHLQNRTRYDFSVKVNYENHLKPIISTLLYEKLIKGNENILEKNISNIDDNNNDDDDMNSKNLNSSPLLYLLANELKCKEEDILDFELCLMDTNKPCFTGVYEEFIEGARFDNLLGTFGVFEAYVELIKNLKNEDNENLGNNLYICIGYDHEEIGSLSEIGAQSYFTKNFIERILGNIFKNELKNNDITIDEIYGSLSNRSLILNVDMAHCGHPNYPETIQQNHHLRFHEGIAIKYNTNKNYVTSPYYACLLKRTFELYQNQNNQKIKYQNFMIKNDTPCGSTVGSMVAANLSMPGMDIGIPQLAMHSIRELAAIHDIYYLVKGIFAFYAYYNQVLSSCVHDS